MLGATKGTKVAMILHHGVLIPLFHFVLCTNIRYASSISIDNYEQFVRMSQNYIGEQYPVSTTKDELNMSTTNCLSHQSDQNTTYMKCDVDKACFVATVLTFESLAAVWKMKEQHRGCWLKTSILSPNCSSSCLFNTQQKSIQFVSFCSCTGSLCNEMNLLYARLENLTQCQTITATSPAVLLEQNSSRSLVITIAISSATLLFIVVCLILLSCLKQKDKRNTCTIELAQSLGEGHLQIGIGSSSMAPNSLDDLLHGNLIHLGYHSAIRLGTFGGDTVAVKVIPPKCSSQFDNEVDIFRILGHHPNIAKFIACEQPLCKGRGIILMEYYQAGSLLNFIRHHTLTWTQVMKIAYSVATGLAYLHEESDGKCENTGISHRDLNTRNILMKLDGTCVLADFGFALKLVGKPASKYHMPVGSPRYMAPEILLRALLSSDWKLSLKQVDIYAFGLILWEVCCSCHEICSLGSNLPPCLLPYEEELSTRPSLNKVKFHVCDMMLRPKLPEQWDPDNINLQSMKMIIKRCWHAQGKERPKAGELLNMLSPLLDAATQTQYRETIEKVELQSSSDLFFKPREISNSLDEYMYDDRDEISQSLLNSHNIEKIVSTVPLTV